MVWCRASLNLKSPAPSAGDLVERIEEAAGSFLREDGHKVIASERYLPHLNRLEVRNDELRAIDELGETYNGTNRPAINRAKELSATSLLVMSVNATEDIQTERVEMDGAPGFQFTYGRPPPRPRPHNVRSKIVKFKHLAVHVTWQLFNVADNSTIDSGSRSGDYREPYSLVEAIRATAIDSMHDL
jgi:hypothetical protein